MEFTLNAESGQIQVTLFASIQGRDGVFWLYGGEKRHIGAVALRECEDDQRRWNSTSRVTESRE